MNEKKPLVITIDGPAGSGKSTVALLVAKQLCLPYLQTSLLYRAAAYLFKDRIRIAHETHSRVDLLPKDIELVSASLSFEMKEGQLEVLCQNVPITATLIEDKQLSYYASYISAYPAIRAHFLEMQRQFALEYGCVAEGRDCGSVVFPDSPLKFYFNASLEVRAKRVAASSRNPSHLSWEEMALQLQERDEKDMKRKISPLTVPEGALIIDTSHVEAEEIAASIIEKAAFYCRKLKSHETTTF